VGNLSPGRQPSSNPVASAEAFEEGLRELGWVEGKNLAFERRYANGTADRLPDLAAELVDLKVDVIFTGAGLPAQRALKDIAGGIPIITVVSVQAPCATGRREGGGAAKPPPPVSYPAERLPPATP